MALARRIGPYIVDAELGRGGMGVVYRVRHVETDVAYALKTLVPTRPGGLARALSRFRREVEVLARVATDAAIVRVHACGEGEDGVPWVVMDLVEGRSLAERLRDEGPLAANDAAGLVAEIARAVDHVHRHDVIHRDLKPENVLLDGAGRPRVVDFGLAYDAFAERLTQTGEVIGTPAFMSPEQVSRGSAGQTDLGPATDVYGLGAILYACLTGRPPFPQREVVALIAAIVRDDPERPSASRVEIPAALDAVCLQALRKDPRRRYASAEALAADLDRFRAGDPVLARPPSRIGRLLGRMRRRWGSFAVVAVAIVTTGVALTALSRGRALRPDEARATLSRLEKRLAGRGELDDGRRRALEQLRSTPAVVGEPELARRAEAIALTARAIESDDAAGRAEIAVALGALVRPDGEVELELVRSIERALSRARRFDVLAELLHGAAPEIVADRAVAADLARAIVAERLDLPGDASAFEVLQGAPGLEEAVRGGLLIARGDALRAVGANGEAIDAYVLAHRSHGVLPPDASLPVAFLGPVQDRLRARLLAPDVDRSGLLEARALSDLLVIAGAGRDPLVPADALELTRRLIDLVGLPLDWPAANEAVEALVGRGLLLSELLGRHGHSGITRFNRDMFNVHYGIVPLRARVHAELARRPDRPNAGALLVLAELVDYVSHDQEDVAEAALAGRATDVAVAAALESPEPWLPGWASRVCWGWQRFELAAKLADRALALDATRPSVSRWLRPREILADSLLQLHEGRMARSEPVDPRALSRCREVILEWITLRPVIVAERARLLDEVGFEEAHLPSTMRADMGHVVVRTVESLADTGEPLCCDEGVDGLIEAGLDRSLGFDPLLRLRLWICLGRHHARHGRLGAARDAETAAIELIRATHPERLPGVGRAQRLRERLTSRAALLEQLGDPDAAARDRAEADRR